MSWSSGFRSSSRAVARQLRTPSCHTIAKPPSTIPLSPAASLGESSVAASRHDVHASSEGWFALPCLRSSKAKGKARALPDDVATTATTAPATALASQTQHHLFALPIPGQARDAWHVPSRPMTTSAHRRLAPTLPSLMDGDRQPGPSREGLAGLGTTHLSPDILLRCTIFDAAGSAKSSSGVFKKSKLCSDHGLEPRDLRKIDSRVPNLVPTILARKGGILVNILHIRAMIKADMVLLFDSYGSSDTHLHSAFVYNLQFNLRQASSTLPYEFRALESILVSVLDALRIELDLIRSWAGRILEGLDDDVDREKLRALLQVSRKLNSFLSRSRGVKGAVTEVLDDDEDMALMYLTDSKKGEARTEASKMDELELLLESFDKQVEEVVAETEQIHNDMSNTQEVVELILDNNRNKLLALDLRTSIATLGISAGTLWAGLFGMNLTSHFEEDQYAFFVSSGFAILTAVVVSAYGIRQLKRLRRVGLQLREPFGMTRGHPRLSKYGSDKRRRWWWPFGAGSSSSGSSSATLSSPHPLAGYGSAYASPFAINASSGSNVSRFGSPFYRVDEKYQQALAQHMSDAEEDPRHAFPTTPASRLTATAANDASLHERRGPLFASGNGSSNVGNVGARSGAQDGASGDEGGVGLSSKWESRKKRKA
ncbi:magnesium ion transporter [Thecaphora frezii]